MNDPKKSLKPESKIFYLLNSKIKYLTWYETMKPFFPSPSHSHSSSFCPRVSTHSLSPPPSDQRSSKYIVCKPDGRVMYGAHMLNFTSGLNSPSPAYGSRFRALKSDRNWTIPQNGLAWRNRPRKKKIQTRLKNTYLTMLWKQKKMIWSFQAAKLIYIWLHILDIHRWWDPYT